MSGLSIVKLFDNPDEMFITLFDDSPAPLHKWNKHDLDFHEKNIL